MTDASRSWSLTGQRADDVGRRDVRSADPLARGRRSAEVFGSADRQLIFSREENFPGRGPDADPVPYYYIILYYYVIFVISAKASDRH